VLLTMWDLIETRNARTLRQYVRWRKGSPISSQRFSVRVDSGVKPVEPLIMLEGGILRRDDVITPAREYVRQQVNVELAETNTAQLNWTSDGSRVRLTYAPETLIGAMWLQFALAISAPKEFRSCRTCGSPFEVSREPTTGRRVDSVFCSDRCKSRDYRARRRQARMLVAEGMSVREVATRVGARVAAVQRWIAQDEERD